MSAYFCNGISLWNKTSAIFPELGEVVQNDAMFIGTGYELRCELDISEDIDCIDLPHRE